MHGQWATVTTPVLVMCGTEQDTPAMLRHAAAALTGFLTSPTGHPADPVPGDRGATQRYRNGQHHD
jgi:hypothetical protein